MTEKLRNSTPIPNWLLGLICAAFIGMFATGWTKIDNLREELTVEKTSRIYIEKSLKSIDQKLDRRSSFDYGHNMVPSVIYSFLNIIFNTFRSIISK